MLHKPIERFPDDFLFGASTSSFQFEGGTDQPGRGVSVQDLHVPPPGITDFSVASDHFHRFEEDIALLAELGLNAYRFSVSWVRILPDGKHVNEEGLRFYDALLDTLERYGIQPIVTIYHFEYPQALIDLYGGWLSREAIDDYVLLARTLFERYGDRVKYWITINEQDHLLKIPYRLGFPKELTGIEYERKAQLANYHLSVAAAKATALCHELIPDAQIGPAVNVKPAIPASSDPKDLLAALAFNELTHHHVLDLNCWGQYSPLYRKYLEDREILPELRPDDLQLMRENPPDFIGINYYFAPTVAHHDGQQIELRGPDVLIPGESGIYTAVDNEHMERSEFGWSICPEGLQIAVIDLYNRYQLPLLFTENGLGARDELVDGKVHDQYRIDYLRSHLQQVKHCLGLGYPILGWCPWSAIDLVSGREGMDKRYGFVYVNRTNDDLRDLKRYKKDSFYWYQEVIRSRGQSL